MDFFSEEFKDAHILLQNTACCAMLEFEMQKKLSKNKNEQESEEKVHLLNSRHSTALLQVSWDDSEPHAA